MKMTKHKRKKRQHCCSGIPEYKQLLYIFNTQSLMYFGMKGVWRFEQMLEMKRLSSII